MRSSLLLSLGFVLLTSSVGRAASAITVSHSPTTIFENDVGTLNFTFTRTAPITASLSVNFRVGGAATFGTDYTVTGAAAFAATTGRVVFAAGAATAVVRIDPRPDTTAEPDETVALTVLAGAGYVLGTGITASDSIRNDDPIGGADNFNDNSRTLTDWGGNTLYGGGLFLDANARLDYQVIIPNPTTGDRSLRNWIRNYPTNNSTSFTTMMDVFNNSNPTGSSQASIGLMVTNLQDSREVFFVEMIHCGPTHARYPNRRGFRASLTSVAAGGEVGPATPIVTNAATGSLLLSYNGNTGVFTFFYDTTGSGNGQQFVNYGSFGIYGSGGTLRNATWLTSKKRGFRITVGGSSLRMAVPVGTVYLDNFACTSP